jgi:uncharacterized membrane protein
MSKHFHWLVLTPLAALAACAGTDSPFRPVETYNALGHDPGWLLTIDRARLRFVTSSPATNLESLRPAAEFSPLGRRYRTDRLTIDIARQPCNDSRSGIAFAETVVVVSSGYTYRGCGGERTPLLDR